MISHFFIRRPRAAFVFAILLTLAGIISVTTLSINMYPTTVTPPVVEVSASYPGASAVTVEQSVVEPLEEQLNGVKGMIYMTSTSSNDGSVSIKISFGGKTDPDIDTVNTQNRVSQAMSKLPATVVQNGVTVRQGNSGSMVLAINLFSPDGSMSSMQMSSYANRYIIDPLARVPNVSKAFMMAAKQYSMRIWLNPDKMHALGITVSDIDKAVKEQNAIVAAGKIGASPAPEDQEFEYTIEAQGRLLTPKQFGDIVLKAKPDGGYIRLHDVAKVKLGSQFYAGNAQLNNKDSIFIAITQVPDSSAIQVAQGVKKEMAKLQKNFPKGLQAKAVYDSTTFISVSVHEVVKTLIEAILLVVLVVFIFLQNWRATLIPTLAVPVSLIGAFAFMNLFGISINLITLFALVLSIGIVVDDAIVVIENVERHIRDGKTPKEAAHQSMKEIAGPILATTFVLLAVFGPVAFIPGVSGQLFQQFSAVLSITVLISAFNALTLSPALCVTLLTPGHTSHLKFMRPAEKVIQRITGRYNGAVGWMIKRAGRVGIIFILLVVGTGVLIKTLPTGFIPMEDQGYLFVNVQLPDASSLNRTNAVMKQMSAITMKQKGVSDINSISGFSLLSGNGSNYGLGIVVLKNWDDRTAKDETESAVQKALQQKFNQIPNAKIQVIQPPTINVGDATGGFSFQLEDTSGHTPQELAQTANNLVAEANQQPELANVFNTFRANVPMYKLEVDRSKAKALGVSLSQVYLTLQAQLGSLYVNDFNMDDKIYEVMLQAEPQFRSQRTDLSHYYVKSDTGKMLPISNFAKLVPSQGAPTLSHFNVYRSVTINGGPAPGYSTGQALGAMMRVAKNMPTGYTYEWSGEAAQELASGNQTVYIFALAILFVYLILTALYESWAVPLVVLAVVPVAAFGASLAMHLFHISMGIYCQIGLLLLIGMAAKATILMAEFAVKGRAAGMSITEAALGAAKIRFRPVTMTSLAFMLGVAPLIFSSGAGAHSRFNIGITIVGGMITVTTAGILLTPIIYRAIQKMREKFGGPAAAKGPESE